MNFGAPGLQLSYVEWHLLAAKYKILQLSMVHEINDAISSLPASAFPPPRAVVPSCSARDAAVYEIDWLMEVDNNGRDRGILSNPSDLSTMIAIVASTCSTRLRPISLREHSNR